LTEEIDALLAENAAMLARAQRQADDLAHGLKTPLTVLTQQADSLRQHGAAPLADLIQDQVERMRGHVDRQLARARAEGARRLGVETPVADVVDG
jgi:signal transduction histidine kinase